MSRCVVFRFDVDTELCLREGVPRLCELAARLDVRFTFFVNPGRAIRRGDLFQRRRAGKMAAAAKLSTLDKLGVGEAAYLLCFNPRVLPRHASVLRDLRDEGHDIGLHGGRNHGSWARNAHRWSAERLASEVDFGISRFEEAGLARPGLFASPGWNSPAELPRILASRGLQILADSHGPRAPEFDSREPLTNAHTALCGEPGGIGYLEFMRARGAGDEAILRDFSQRLEAEAQYACVYDHPFYAGRHEAALLESLIHLARSKGWEVAPLSRALAVEKAASSR